MATKTFFIKDVAVNAFGSLSETDPGAATTGSGWTVAKIAAANFSKLIYGTERASGTFSTTDALTTPAVPSAGDSWRSENRISGSFANTNWTMTCAVRAVGAASAQAGRVKCRIWRSANADGSGATQITSSILTGTTTGALSTTADVLSTVTFAPGGIITLSGEYLFVQCEWEITTVSGSNSSDVLFQTSSSKLLTSDFTLGSISGNLNTTEAADTLAAVGKIQVSGNLNATENPDTLAATGTVASAASASKPAAALLIGS